MKKHLSTIIVAVTFLLGVGLMIYPTFSNWWNERHQSRAIATYQEAVDGQDDSANEAMLAAADAYNEALLAARQDESLRLGLLTEDQLAEYNSLLDVTGTGIMGYVRIPKIDVELPIYHGTDEAVLQIAVGHIEGSSLPIGGKGTHAAISGHRGLPSATLFTNIANLGEGDIFIIQVLNRKITYEVDQIKTVLPTELDDLEIDPEMDYCTLVTCTPYGINSHRLLVRGHRIANLVESDVETIQIEIPERERSWQEYVQQIILPYGLILAAGFFGLALILPARKSKKSAEDEDWERRARERDERRRDRAAAADQEAVREHKVRNARSDTSDWMAQGEDDDHDGFLDDDDHDDTDASASDTLQDRDVEGIEFYDSEEEIDNDEE